MLHPSFQVFGVRIYLQEQDKLLCTRVDNLNKEEQYQSLQENEVQKTVISVNNDEDNEDEEQNENKNTKKIDDSKNNSRSRAPLSSITSNMFFVSITALAFYFGQFR
jgi:ABC-type multidrug transport system fused ATPase/permease subunit